MDIDQLALDTAEAIAKIDPDKLKGGQVRAKAQAQCLIRDALRAYADDRDALAAHVERVKERARLITDRRQWEGNADPRVPHVLLDKLSEVCMDAPTTSLARIRAQAKAEAFENLANYNGSWTQTDMRSIASDYRRQASEPTS